MAEPRSENNAKPVGAEHRRIRWRLTLFVLAVYICVLTALLFIGRKNPLRPLIELEVGVASFVLPCLTCLLASRIHAALADQQDN